jgi:hypothetical protein
MVINMGLHLRLSVNSLRRKLKEATPLAVQRNLPVNPLCGKPKAAEAQWENINR